MVGVGQGERRGEGKREGLGESWLGILKTGFWWQRKSAAQRYLEGTFEPLKILLCECKGVGRAPLCPIFSCGKWKKGERREWKGKNGKNKKGEEGNRALEVSNT